VAVVTPAGTTLDCGSGGAGADLRASSAGILPRTLDVVLSELHGDTRCKCYVSFYEVYNEKVQDLLAALLPPDPDAVGRRRKRPPAVHFHPRFGAFVDGLVEVSISQLDDVVHVISVGAQTRTTAVTGLNERSSRSHAVFTLRIERGAACNTLMMVDLAGREQEKVMQTAQCCGKRFKELTLINRSLFHLAQCVRTLAAEGSERAGVNVSGSGQGHHFRNSKLTMLLGHSLAGNSYTTLIGTLSPSRNSHEDSLSTLRFCESVKQVKTRPAVSDVNSDDAVSFLEEEVRRLCLELSRAQTGRQIVERQLIESQAMMEHYRASWQSAVQQSDGKSDTADVSALAVEVEMGMPPAGHIGGGLGRRSTSNDSLRGVCGLPKRRYSSSERQGVGSPSSPRRLEARLSTHGTPLQSHRSWASDFGTGGNPAETGVSAGSPPAVALARRAMALVDHGSSAEASHVRTSSYSASDVSTPRVDAMGTSKCPAVASSPDSDKVSADGVDSELRRAVGHWLQASEGGTGGSGGRAALIETIQRLHSQLCDLGPCLLEPQFADASSGEPASSSCSAGMPHQRTPGRGQQGHTPSRDQRFLRWEGDDQSSGRAVSPRAVAEDVLREASPKDVAVEVLRLALAGVPPAVSGLAGSAIRNVASGEEVIIGDHHARVTSPARRSRPTPRAESECDLEDRSGATSAGIHIPRIEVGTTFGELPARVVTASVSPRPLSPHARSSAFSPAASPRAPSPPQTLGRSAIRSPHASPCSSPRGSPPPIGSPSPYHVAGSRREAASPRRRLNESFSVGNTGGGLAQDAVGLFSKKPSAPLLSARSVHSSQLDSAVVVANSCTDVSSFVVDPPVQGYAWVHPAEASSFIAAGTPRTLARTPRAPPAEGEQQPRILAPAVVTSPRLSTRRIRAPKIEAGVGSPPQSRRMSLTLASTQGSPLRHSQHGIPQVLARSSVSSYHLHQSSPSGVQYSSPQASSTTIALDAPGVPAPAGAQTMLPVRCRVVRSERHLTPNTTREVLVPEALP